MLCNIPLCGERKEIISPFGEVPLLVSAAINERHVVQTEGANCVLMAEVTKNAARVEFWIAHNIGHAGLLPSFKSFLMAGPATFGTNEMRPGGRRLLRAGIRGVFQGFGIPLRKQMHGKDKMTCNETEHERMSGLHQLSSSAGPGAS
jgi:hypothetical protein